MKKIISCLLAVLILASLCGCGVGVDVTGDIESVNNTNTVSEETSSNEEVEFSAGKTQNNVYKNEFLGLTCTLPSDWVFYTEDQIAELNKQTMAAADDATASLVQNATIIYDMYAQNPNDASNVNINLEKFSAIQMATMSVKKTLEGQFDALKSTYENMGFTNVNIYYNEIVVDGKTLDGARLTAEFDANGQKINFYAVMFCFKKGSYLANVSLGSSITDKTADILKYFTMK